MSLPSPGAIVTMQQVADGRRLLQFGEGDVIFRAGEPGDTVYGVLEGSVQVSWGDGSQYEILGPGSSFGVGALVDPEHRRYGTATAMEDTKLLQMNREQFLFAMQELPMFGLEMLLDLDERLRQLKARGLGTG
jgi:CRP-like cAMP-binding protein